MRAKNNDCPEALLAAVDAPTAKGIVGNAVSVVEEERPFQTPLLIVMLISYPHFRKKGYLLPFYMIGYGVIRFFVEGLRTDSLYLMPGVRVSQVLSGCLILLGVLLIGIIRRRKDIQV